jgi:hypothetical protein
MGWDMGCERDSRRDMGWDMGSKLAACEFENRRFREIQR